MSRKTEARSIKGNWVFHKKEMRESPAWRHLPNHARRVLDRLELEFMQHGGATNGDLVCTYTQFEEAGIPPKAIALAIRQCAALGFITIKPGQKSAAQFHAPSTYFLTYLPSRGRPVEGAPNSWREVEDDEQAMRLLAKAEKARRYDTQPVRSWTPQIQKAGPL